MMDGKKLKALQQMSDIFNEIIKGHAMKGDMPKDGMVKMEIEMGNEPEEMEQEEGMESSEAPEMEEQAEKQAEEMPGPKAQVEEVKKTIMPEKAESKEVNLLNQPKFARKFQAK